MRKIIVGAIVSAVLVAASPATASLTSYLALTGKSSGKVTGSVVQKGREGRIAVIASEHRVQAGGKQGLFVITKEVDKSSPILYKMMASNEPIDFDFQTWDTSGGSGVEVSHYKVKLTNARITSIKLAMANNRNPDSVKSSLEEVSFTYESITWSYDANSATASATNGKAP